MKFRYKENPNTRLYWEKYYTERIIERLNRWLIPIVLKYLSQYRAIPPSMQASVRKEPRALEIGCGAGRTIGELLKMRSDVQWTGMDYSEVAIAKAKSKYHNASFYWCDVEKCYEHEGNSLKKIISANDQYEFILCTETLEHMSNPQSVCKLMYKWLKVNGTILITVPYPGSPLDTNSINLHHVSFEMEDFENVLFPFADKIVIFQIDKHHLGIVVRKVEECLDGERKTTH